MALAISKPRVYLYMFVCISTFWQARASTNARTDFATKICFPFHCNSYLYILPSTITTNLERLPAEINNTGSTDLFCLVISSLLFKRETCILNGNQLRVAERVDRITIILQVKTTTCS